MRFANYGRKSVASDHSDSIDNQFRMSKSYAEMHFPGQIDSFVQYSDEDYTGSNANRPDLKRLLEDVKEKMIDVLIVYQLDRLSRSVRDFSNIYAILDEYGVKFISLKENIDTTTPIGRAMMYVSVVFAQMERETIANRIDDNMTGLAKKGYWVGGNPPIGYVRERVVIGGKKHVVIAPEPEGVEHVNFVMDTFLNNKFSLQNMETYFRKSGIRTKSGAFYSTTQIHKVLTMPFCVAATEEIYDYYAQKGCAMDPSSPRNMWDGSMGVMVYGRTTEKSGKHQNQPPEKWLVCLGKHKPFLSAEKWLAVQNQLTGNKFDKTMKYDIPLLKGVLRCSCGSIMQVSRKKRLDGVSSWYYCLKRMRQGVEVCGRSQIKTELLDQKVLDIFSEIEQDHTAIFRYASNSTEICESSNPAAIQNKIASCEARIGKLTASLALSDNSTAQKYIISEIERLDLELQALRHEYSVSVTERRKIKTAQKTADDKAREISRLLHDFDNFTAAERNAIVRDVVKECIWDGETLSVTL